MDDQVVNIEVKVHSNAAEVQKEIDAIGEDDLLKGAGRSGGLGYDVAQPNTRPIPQAPGRNSILNNPYGMMGQAGPFGEYGGGILNEPASLKPYKPKIIPDPLKPDSENTRAGLIYDSSQDRNESPLERNQRIEQENNATDNLKNFREDSKYDRLQRTNYFSGSGYTEKTYSDLDKKQIRPSDMAEYRDKMVDYYTPNETPMNRQAIRDEEKNNRENWGSGAARTAPVILSAAQEYKKNKDNNRYKDFVKEFGVVGPLNGKPFDDPLLNQYNNSFNKARNNAKAGLIGENEFNLNPAGNTREQANEALERSLFDSAKEEKYDTFKKRALEKKPDATEEEMQAAFAKKDPDGELNHKLVESDQKTLDLQDKILAQKREELKTALVKNAVAKEELNREREQAKALVENKIKAAEDAVEDQTKNPIKVFQAKREYDKSTQSALNSYGNDLKGIEEKEKDLEKEEELIRQQINNLGKEADAESQVGKQVEKTTNAKRDSGRVDSTNSTNLKKFFQIEGADRDSLIEQIKIQRQVVEEMSKGNDTQPAALARANRELAELINKEKDLTLAEAKSTTNLEKRNELIAKSIVLTEEETSLRGRSDVLTNNGDSNNRKTPAGKGFLQGVQAATQTDEIGSFFGSGGIAGMAGAFGGLAVAGAAMIGFQKHMQDMQDAQDLLKTEGGLFTDNGGAIDKYREYEKQKQQEKMIAAMQNGGSATGEQKAWDATTKFLGDIVGSPFKLAGGIITAQSTRPEGVTQEKWDLLQKGRKEAPGFNPFDLARSKAIWESDDDYQRRVDKLDEEENQKKAGPHLEMNRKEEQTFEELQDERLSNEKKIAAARIHFEEDIAAKRLDLSKQVAEYDKQAALKRADIETSIKQENEDYATNKSRLIEDRSFKASEQKRDIDRAGADRDFGLKQSDEKQDLETKINNRAEDIATQTGDERRDLKTKQGYGQEDLDLKQKNEMRDFQTAQGRGKRDLATKIGDNNAEFITNSDKTLEDFHDSVNDLGLHNGSATDYLSLERDTRKNIRRSAEQLSTTNSRMARDGATQDADKYADLKTKQSDEKANLRIDEKRQWDDQGTKESDRLRDTETDNSRNRKDLDTKQGRDKRDYENKKADDDAKHAIDVQQHQLDLQEKLNDLEVDHTRNLDALNLSLKKLDDEVKKAHDNFAEQSKGIDKEKKDGEKSFDNSTTNADAKNDKDQEEFVSGLIDALPTTEAKGQFLDDHEDLAKIYGRTGAGGAFAIERYKDSGNDEFAGYKTAADVQADINQANADPKGFTKLHDWKSRIDQWGNEEKFNFLAKLNHTPIQAEREAKDIKEKKAAGSTSPKDSGGFINETRNYLLHEGEYVVNPRSTDKGRQESYAKAALSELGSKTTEMVSPAQIQAHTSTEMIKAAPDNTQSYAKSQSLVNIENINIEAGSGLSKDDANKLVEDIKGYAETRARYYGEQARNNSSQDFNRNLTAVARSRN